MSGSSGTKTKSLTSYEGAQFVPRRAAGGREGKGGEEEELDCTKDQSYKGKLRDLTNRVEK